MNTLIKQKPFLFMVLNAHKEQVVALLKTLSDDQVRLLTEVTINLLKGNMPVPVQQLKRYKSLLREIGHKRLKINKQKIARYASEWYRILSLVKPSLLKILAP